MPSSPSSTNADRSVSDRLREFRNSHGLSRADLAAKLGISTVTVYRWETGGTRPSPLAGEKLADLGFSVVEPPEPNASSIPRLWRSGTSKQAIAAAARLREKATISIRTARGSLDILPSPFVRNGPPDQTAFHRRLLNMQFQTELPPSDLNRRLSMVEEVQAIGQTAQHRLENPRPVAVSWNSNYGSHGWHRYIGRFPPHVVRALLNHFAADRHSIVCDPFVGSGTTAVECRLLGIPFVGVEICPLSAMISRTKARFPNDPQVLYDLAKDFLKFYASAWTEFLRSRSASGIAHEEILQRPGNTIPPFSNLQRWFTPEALLGTSIAVQFGLRKRGFEREAVLLALSAKMRSIGNVDVDVVRAEYRKSPRTNVDVGRLVARHITKMAKNVASSLETHADLIGPRSNIAIKEGSVFDVDLGQETISHIITSPPYGIEAISYLRTHLLSYRSLVSHLNHDPYQTRDKTIGSEYLEDIGNVSEFCSISCSQTCRSFFGHNFSTADRKFGQRRAAMMQFCDDMLSVGQKMAHWLKPGGKVAFIIGNKKLGEAVIPMDKIVTELFAESGLKLVDVIRHKLKTNNSNSQVPWQNRIIQKESIMLFTRTVQ